jgi:hypothetical protein
MGALPESYPTDYVAGQLATYERAIDLAVELRRLDFSPHTIAYELGRYHGFAEPEAARIVREAAARDHRETDALGALPTGIRDGRRWLDLSGVLSRPDQWPEAEVAAPVGARH